MYQEAHAMHFIPALTLIFMHQAAAVFAWHKSAMWFIMNMAMASATCFTKATVRHGIIQEWGRATPMSGVSPLHNIPTLAEATQAAAVLIFVAITFQVVQHAKYIPMI